MLILASRSPRRRDLLRAAGIEFRAVDPPVDDRAPIGRRGRWADLVRHTALQKALSVARRRPAVVLGADTVVVCNGRLLGKPVDAEDARRMLTMLSDRWHSVYTGVALVCDGDRLVDYERTQVMFRRLSKEDIERYVASSEPDDKAGAYAIQGRGAALVRTIRGCYTNVVGLPLPKLIAMLTELEQPSDVARAALRGWR